MQDLDLDPAEKPPSLAAMEQFRLIDANAVILLNHSVLLAKINDNSKILGELSRSLFSLNVLPYYLHLPDRVAGTAHYAVSHEKGLGLMAELEERLPG